MGKWDLKREGDDRYLRQKDDTTVTLRILDAEPHGKFAHWIGRRMLTCPGLYGACPACIANKAAEAQGSSDKPFPARAMFIMNALVYQEEGDPKVQIFSFGNEIAGQFEEIEKQQAMDGAADIRDFDVKIVRKKKDGKVKYNVLPKAPSALSAEYQAMADERHDLEKEIQPSTPEQISAAMKSSRSGRKEEDEAEVSGGSSKIVPQQLKLIQNRIDEINARDGSDLKIVDFGYNPRTMTADDGVELMQKLSAGE